METVHGKFFICQMICQVMSSTGATLGEAVITVTLNLEQAEGSRRLRRQPNPAYF